MSDSVWWFVVGLAVGALGMCAVAAVVIVRFINYLAERR